MNFLEVFFMSPLDMLIFLFFILVTIKAASSCIDYWKDTEEVAVEVSVPKVVRTKAVRTQAAPSVTVRTVRPSSVRVTPIKRVNIPAAASSRIYFTDQQITLKEKGAA